MKRFSERIRVYFDLGDSYWTTRWEEKGVWITRSDEPEVEARANFPSESMSLWRQKMIERSERLWRERRQEHIEKNASKALGETE